MQLRTYPVVIFDPDVLLEFVRGHSATVRRCDDGEWVCSGKGFYFSDATPQLAIQSALVKMDRPAHDTRVAFLKQQFMDPERPDTPVPVLRQIMGELKDLGVTFMTDTGLDPFDGHGETY